MKNEYRKLFEAISPDDELLDSVLFDKALDIKKRVGITTGKRLVAILTAITILCCSISAGAAVYFKPDSRFAQSLTIDYEIDLSTLGYDIDQSCEYGGYELKLTQVLSDNNIFNCLFDCPTIDGYMLVPHSVDIFVNSLPYFDSYGEGTYVNKDCHSFNSVISGLRNIKNGDKITLKIHELYKYDLKTDEYLLNDIIEGNWEFEFKVKRADVKKKIETVDMITINNKQFEIDRATISPLGLYLDIKSPENDAFDFANSHIDFTKNGGFFIKIEMNDGTAYTDKCENNEHYLGTSISSSDSNSIQSNFVFSETVDIDNIKSITIANTEIYNN